MCVGLKVLIFFNKSLFLSLLMLLTNYIFVLSLENKSTKFMISQPSTFLSGNFTKRLLAVLLFAMCFGKSSAQGWERFYGGNKVDRGHAIIQTIDRGFLMVGFSESFGDDNDQDVYVVKNGCRRYFSLDGCLRRKFHRTRQ